MKNATKITLIVATICLVLGGILSFGALAAAQFDFRSLSTASETTQHLYRAERGDYQSITLNGKSEDYSIIRGESDVIEIEYYTTDSMDYSFVVSGNALTIEEQHSNKMRFMNFNFDFIPTQTVVKLPANFVGDIDFNGASSNVTAQDLDIRSMKVQVASGAIYVDDLMLEESLDLDCVSGRIELHSVAARSLSVDGMSADVSANSLILADRLDIAVVSGGINVYDAQAHEAKLSTGSGDIDADTVAAQSVSAETMSGTIHGVKITSPQVSFRTTSGDVVVNMRGNQSEYRIVTNNISGEINAPSGNDEAAGNIILETTSGSIDLSFTPHSGMSL